MILVLWRCAQTRPKPLNIIVNSLAVLIPQCRAHTSHSFFVHISSDSCNKTYCSLYPLTFSGNIKACLQVLFSCSNDLSSCQTQIIPGYKQSKKKSAFQASLGAAAIETRTMVFAKVKRKDHITVVVGGVGEFLTCIYLDYWRQNSRFRCPIFPSRLVYDLVHKSVTMTSLVCYFHLTYDPSLWRVSKPTLKSLNYKLKMVTAF